MAMGKRHNQLTRDEREKISILKASGKSLREIAFLMGRHHSTLSRELRRNCFRAFGFEGYGPAKAEITARKRKSEASKRPRLKNQQIRDYAEEKLKLGWSPEQISGRLKIENPSLQISYEALYQHVYAEATHLIPYLPRRHKRRRVKAKRRQSQKMPIPHRISIDQRPEEINQRQSLGHWEADSAVSRASLTSLHVLLERKSRYVKLTKMRRNSASCVRTTVTRRLKPLPKKARLSITYDNGSENFNHLDVNQELKTQSYFCNPYHSWEKGSVENVISLIRRYLPKKTDISTITKEQIKHIENQLNNRPKKCLDFYTPLEIFSSVALPG